MRILPAILLLLVVSSCQAAVHVTGVTLARDPKGWRVDLKASGKAAYSVHALPSPDRLIIDVPDATLTVPAQVKPVADVSAPELRYSQFTRKPDSVRVVVHLPAPSKWYEISASPAMNIAVLVPFAQTSPAAVKTAAVPEKKPAPAVRTASVPARKAASSGKKAAAAPKPAPPKPAGPKVLSARELEKTLPKAQKPTAQKPPAQKQTRAAAPPASASRSSVTSRGGSVDRTELMGSLLSLPPEALALPPVAPAWSTEDAVALINSADCPPELRRRLIEVVSDPAIQVSSYVWGAETPGQFDCSGLMLYIYQALNVPLPRVSVKQAEAGAPVDRGNLRPGDLLFFNTRGNVISHVGVYLGSGRFLHAANPRENLRITDLDSAYYSQRFVTARRVYAPETAAPPAADTPATEDEAISPANETPGVS